jgi:hypothetical protein
MPCKIVQSVDYGSKEWKDYCLWRNYNFTDFRSLDSILRKSQFDVVEDEDWDHVLTIGDRLTDVILDVEYAKIVQSRYKNSQIEHFEFADDEMDITYVANVVIRQHSERVEPERTARPSRGSSVGFADDYGPWR